VSQRGIGEPTRLLFGGRACIPLHFASCLVQHPITIKVGNIFIGFVPCQLDEVPSWKIGKGFNKKQFYKRLIEEYGIDASKNELWTNCRVICFDTATYFIIFGMISIGLAIIHDIFNNYFTLGTWYIFSLLVLITIYYFAIKKGNDRMENYNKRIKRFEKMKISEQWSKL